MQFTTLVFASLASLALGQVSSTSAAARPTQSSSCAAQNILEACLSTTKGQVNSCTGNDWDCLCTAYGVVLTCYNNCPNDPNVFGVQQSRDQYCAAATAYGTKSSTRSGTATAAAATSTASSATRASSATASSASATAHSNAAAGVQVGSGIIAVALAGLGLLA